MITKLVLRNFQKHKKLPVRLGKITTIIGSTDAGKSSIVRAIRWALLNRPSGTGFVSHGADTCRVRAIVDAQTVVRERGKSRNAYKLDDQEYKAFGNKVPVPVEEAVNVCEDNFQKQHDAPYWLSLSPGELSRALNEVVDLEVIDRTLRNLNREVRSAKSRVEVTRERLKEAKVERKRLSDVPKMNRQLVALEEQQKEYQSKCVRRDGLIGIIDDVTEAQSVVSRMKKTVGGMKEQLKAIEQKWQERKTETDRWLVLRTAIDRICDAEENIEDIERERKSVEEELSQYETCPWCGAER